MNEFPFTIIFTFLLIHFWRQGMNDLLVPIVQVIFDEGRAFWYEQPPTSNLAETSGFFHFITPSPKGRLHRQTKLSPPCQVLCSSHAKNANKFHRYFHVSPLVVLILQSRV